MNKTGQKVHFSIEYFEKFSDTGKAYMVGLAVTDDPASLGTGYMQLSTRQADGSVLPTHLAAFDEAQEFSFAQDSTSLEGEATSFFNKLSSMLSSLKTPEQATPDAAMLRELTQGMEELAKAVVHFHDDTEKKLDGVAQLRKELTDMKNEFAGLKETPHNYTPRPKSDGDGGRAKAEF